MELGREQLGLGTPNATSEQTNSRSGEIQELSLTELKLGGVSAS